MTREVGGRGLGWITPRRGALLAIGGLAAGTVAAVTMRRKPPEVATLRAAPEERLQGFSAMVPTVPAAALPAAVFLDAAGSERRVGGFAGRGLVVNLWATWCVPCVAEMPALARMARLLEGDGISVLPLSSDRGGAAVVRAFYAAHGIEGLGVWLDPAGALQRAWGARGLPTTVVIDRAGMERGRLEGAVDWASAEALAGVRALIG